MDGSKFCTVQSGQKGSCSPGQRERVTFTKLHEIKPSQSSQLLTLILVLFQTLKTTRKGFYYFKKIVPPFLSWVSTQVLMHAFISSRLDYCNTLLSGLHKKKEVIIYNYYKTHLHACWGGPEGRSTKQQFSKLLHWLPVCLRIEFKVLLLVFKCLNGLVLMTFLLVWPTFILSPL